MDQNSPARSPLSLSSSFYDEATKDMQSPLLSKEFYDSAVGKPETERTPIEPVSGPASVMPAARPKVEEDSWLGGAGKALLSSAYGVAQSLAGAVRFVEEQSPRSLARTPFELASLAAKPVDWAAEKISGTPYAKGEAPADVISKAGKGLFSGLSDTPIIGSVEKAVGIEKPIGAQLGDVYSKLAKEAAPQTNEDTLKHHVFGAIQSLGPAVGAILAGIVTKKPDLSLNLFFLNAAGTEYDEQRRAGTDVAKASAAGLVSGAAEKYTEKLPMEALVKKGTTFWKRLAQSTALDIPGELLATTFQEGLVKKATTNPDLSMSDYFHALKDTAIQAAMVGPMQTGVIHPVLRHIENQQIKDIQKEVSAEGFGERPSGDVAALYRDVEALKTERPDDAVLTELGQKIETTMAAKGIDIGATDLFKRAMILNQKVGNGESVDADEIEKVTNGLAEKGMNANELELSHEISKAFATIGYLDGVKSQRPLSSEEEETRNDAESRLNATLGELQKDPNRPLPAYAVGADGIVYTKAPATPPAAEPAAKPAEPPKSAARDALLGDEPVEKKNATTAKGVLTGELDIQSEEDLENPEVQAGINKILSEGGAPETGGVVGGARAPLEPQPEKVVDITETVKAQDQELFSKWDAEIDPAGSPAFIRNNVDKLFSEGGDAAVLGAYPKDDTTSRYAKYRMEQLKAAQETKEPWGMSFDEWKTTLSDNVRSDPGLLNERRLQAKSNVLNAFMEGKDVSVERLSEWGIDIKDPNAPLWVAAAEKRGQVIDPGRRAILEGTAPPAEETPAEEVPLTGVEAWKPGDDEEGRYYSSGTDDFYIRPNAKDTEFTVQSAEGPVGEPFKSLDEAVAEVEKLRAGEGVAGEAAPPEAKVIPDLKGNDEQWDALADEVASDIEALKAKKDRASWEDDLVRSGENELYSPTPLALDALSGFAGSILTKKGYTNTGGLSDAEISERLRQSIIRRKEAGGAPVGEAAPQEGAIVGGARAPLVDVSTVEKNPPTLAEQYKEMRSSLAQRVSENYDPQRREAYLKGQGMEISAIVRHLEGRATDNEIKAEITKLDSNQVGKRVTTPDGDGVVMATPTFGKIKVNVNGTEKSYPIADITSPPATPEQAKESLRAKAETEAKRWMETFGEKPKPGAPEIVGGAKSPAAERVDQAAAEADTNPPPGKIESGTYKKGHPNPEDVHGLKISIETAKGETRRGEGPEGPWEVTMPIHYGHVLGTMGKDKDPVDVSIGDHPESDRAFIIDQQDPKTGKFDEHKTFVSLNTAEEARAAYIAGFQDDSGPSRIMGITEMSIDEYKEWLKGDHSKPASQVVKPAEEKAARKPEDLTADEWAKESIQNKIEMTDLDSKIESHPDFAELKGLVDRKWRRSQGPNAKEFEANEYLTSDLGDQELQNRIAEDLGIGITQSATFKARYLDIPQPKAKAPAAEVTANSIYEEEYSAAQKDNPQPPYAGIGMPPASKIPEWVATAYGNVAKREGVSAKHRAELAESFDRNYKGNIYERDVLKKIADNIGLTYGKSEETQKIKRAIMEAIKAGPADKTAVLRMTQDEAVDRTYPPGKNVPAAPDGATASLNGQPATKRGDSWSYVAAANGQRITVTDPVTKKRLDYQVAITKAYQEGYYDKAIADGTLTQEKADEILRALPAGVKKLAGEAVVGGARAEGAPAAPAATTKTLPELVGDFVDQKLAGNPSDADAADIRKMDKMRNYNEAALNSADGIAKLPQWLQKEFAAYRENPMPITPPAAPEGEKAPELSPIEKELAGMPDNFDFLDEEAPAKTAGERAPVTGGRREGVPGVAAIAAEAGEEKAAPAAPAARGAADAAQALEIAAKHGLEGAADAFKGLYELFGGGALKSFPGGLDRETYDKAKPHFEAAYQHAIEVGKSVKQFYDIVVEMIGNAIKPYVKHFLAVKRAELLGEAEPAFPAAETTATGTEEIVGGERAGETANEPVNLDEEKPAEEGEKAEGEKIVGGARKPRLKKLQDTGVMAGKISGKTHAERVQLIKISLDKAAVGEPAAIVKAIQNLTTKADIFKINDNVPGRTPGLNRWLNSFRSKLNGFLKYAGRRYGGGMGKWSTSYRAALERQVDSPEGQAEVRELAARYISMLQEIQEATSDSLTIAQAVQNIYAKILAEPGINTPFMFEKSKDPKTLLNEFGKELANYTGRDALISYRDLKDQLGPVALQMINSESDETRNLPIVRRRINLVDIATSDEYRHGANVTGVDLKAALGVRDVEYGEWTDALHRQMSVNLTYDSFFDLAKILGAPVNGIAAPYAGGSRLGLAFGSRGRGKAAAHYEPGNDVTNLTKTHGDGSLAHELMHRLHHKLQIMHANRHGQMKNVFEDVIDSLMIEYRLENLEKRVEDILRGLDYSIRKYSPTGNRLEDAKKFLKENMEAEFKHNTRFFENALDLDGRIRDKYWSKRTELLSRAFEGFVADELQGENRYLVDVDFVAPGATESLFNRISGAYPSEGERERFNLIFSRLWDGMVWAEDGTVSMKPDFVLVSEQQRADAEAAVQRVQDKLEAWYNLIYKGEQSADGLYWYAYEVSERGATMQPAGYGAYDDAYRIAPSEVAEGEEAKEIAGRGAVGYLDQLGPDDVVKYRFVPIVHEQNETTITVKEEENGISGNEDQTALAGGETENGGATDIVGGVRGGTELGTGEGEGGNGLVDQEGNPVVGGGRGGAGPVAVPHGGGTGNLDSGSDALLADRIDFVIHSVDAPTNTSKAAAFNANLAAIRTLKKIEAENRRATAAEQILLFQFQGWGNLSEALAHNPKDAWKDRAEMLARELTEEELDAARENILTGYYTPLGIYDSLYRALSKFGYQGGNFLSAATGIGHELGLMPAQMRRNSNITAVEMDSISARIAQQLYQNAQIINQPFEKVTMPEGFFDLAMTNVPFAESRPYDAKYNQDRFELHDYFINKQLAGLREGGLMIVITTSGTLDNTDSRARDLFARTADLVGAIRLPNGAFKDQGTDITTDILILKKRFATEPSNGIKFSKTESITLPEVEGARSWDRNQTINEYFVAHPEMVMGTMGLKRDRWGNFELGISGPNEGAALTDLIDTAIQTLPDGLYRKDITLIQSDIGDRIPAADFAKDGGLFLSGNTIMRNEAGTSVKWEPDIKKSGKNKEVPKGMSVQDYTNKVKKMIRSYIGLRGTLRDLLRAQYKNTPDMETLRKKLNDDYAAFVKAFGRINERNNLRHIMEDVDGGQISALEIWKYPEAAEIAPEEGEEAAEVSEEEARPEGVFDSLAAIFTRNTAKITEPPKSAETASDALLHSLMWKGRIDLPYMEELLGVPRAEITKQLKGLIYNDPKIGWVPADEYLSGDVKDKLRAAEEAAAIDPQYAENVRQLQAIVPVDLETHQIPAHLGAPWIPAQYISEFANTLMRRGDIEVKYVPLANTWTINVGGSSEKAAKENRRYIEQSVAASSTWGTHRVNFLELLEFALNGGMPRVMGGLSVTPDPETGRQKNYSTRDPITGNMRHAFNPEETEAAYAKLDDIRTKFESWLWVGNNDRTAKVAKRYNDLHNQIVDRKFDGSHLLLPGKVPDEIIHLLPHQMNAIWRYLTTGRAYFAHEVGVGKTFAMVASIMESKRLGLANKPVFAVKNATIDQIRSDFYRLYPGANVLTVDMLGKTRKEDMRKIATGNYDAVIMSHEALQRIPVSPETEMGFIRRELEKLTRAITAEANRNLPKWRATTERELQKKLRKLQDRLNALLHQEKEEGISTFEEMGIDMLVIDEAHAFKNLDIETKYKNVKGLKSKESNRAEDIFMKTQYLLDKYKRGLIFASGTPLSNSIGELYSLQQHFQSDELSRTGIDGFDQWAATFGVIGQQAEPAPEGGGYQLVTRFLKFRGIPELTAKVRKFMDLMSADEVGIPRPKIANPGGKPDLIQVAQSQWHQRHQNSLMFRADEIRRFPGMLKDKPAGLPKNHKHEWHDSGLRQLTCATCGARWEGANYHGVPDLMLRILHDGRDAALDPRIIDPSLPDNPNTKTNALVKEVFAIYKAEHEAEDPFTGDTYKETKGVQLIFSDRGVPGTDRFSVYDDIKNKLVALGVPAKEIAFIQEATNAKGGPREKEIAKRKLLEKARAGTIRILIGGTQNLGTGTNVQDRVVALHNLDADWNAANQTQRIGRAIRRGNRIKAVFINNYGVLKGVDSFMWSTVGQKQYVLSQVLSKNPLIRDSEDISVDDLSAKEFSAKLANDPLVEEKFVVDADVRKLRAQRGVFDLTRREQQAELQGIPPHIERIREAMKPLIRGNEIIQKATAIKIGDDFYDLSKDGGKVNELAAKIFPEEFMSAYFAAKEKLQKDRDALREKYDKLKKKVQQDSNEWYDADQALKNKFATDFKMDIRAFGRLGYIIEEKVLVKAEKPDLPAAFTATETDKENIITLAPPAKKAFTAEEKALVKGWAKKHGYTLTEGEDGYSVSGKEGEKIALPVPGAIPEDEVINRKFEPIEADVRVSPALAKPGEGWRHEPKAAQFVIRASDATTSTDHEVSSGFNSALTAFKKKHTTSIADMEKEITGLEEKAVSLEEAVAKPFPKAKELQDKTLRQQQLADQLVEVQRLNEERRRAEAAAHAKEEAEREKKEDIVAEGELPPLPENFRTFKSPVGNAFSIFPAEGATFTDEEKAQIRAWADAQVLDVEPDGTGFRVMKTGFSPIEIPTPQKATPTGKRPIEKVALNPGEGIVLDLKPGEGVLFTATETKPVVTQEKGNKVQKMLDEFRRTAKQKWGGDLYDGDTETRNASQDVLDKLADMDQPEKAAYAREKIEFLTFDEFFDATRQEEYDSTEEETEDEKALRAEYDQKVYEGEDSPIDYYTWTAKQAQAMAVVAQYDGNREEGAAAAQSRLDAVKDAWIEENGDDPRSPEFEEAIQAAQKVITTVRSGQTLLFPEQFLYSVQRDTKPGVSLADVQSVFKGQEVIQPGGVNSSIYIKTRGGRYLAIEKVDFISPDEVEFELSHGEKFDPETMTITGTYGQGNIRLRRDKAGKWTLVHEVEHFLEDAGIINAEDVAILREYIQRMVAKGKIKTANREDIGGVEDRANYLADAVTKEPPGGLVGLVIARVQKFLDRLGAAFGVRTAGMVAREVSSGKIYEREGKYVGEEGEVYSATRDGSLAFVHSLSVDNLRHAIKMGGLAVPSTAVIDVNKSSFNRFGDITLIASAERLGPGVSKQNKYFNADAYSPRYPKVNYFLTPKSAKALDAYLDPLWKEIPKAKDRQGGISSHSVLIDRIQNDGIEATFTSGEPLLQYAFLKETGRLPEGVDTSYESKTKIREAVEAIGRDQFEAWGTKKIKDLGLTAEEKIPYGWTSNGNRRYLAHNLGTVVRLLTKELKDGEGFNYGVPSVRAANAIQLRSLKQIKENRDKIVTPEAMKDIKEKTEAEFMALAGQAIAHLKYHRGMGVYDDFSDHLKEAIKTHNFNKIFGAKSEYYDEGVDVNGLIDFVNSLRNMPTEYFEGKIQRVVGLTEFERAVVPDNTPKDLIEWLTARGINVDTYSKNDAADRKAKVKGAATAGGLLYSVEKNTDSAYLAAVEAGDMATAQKLVDKAAKDAGYNIGTVYHGGAEPDITVFDPSRAGTIQRADWGTGVYFGTDRFGANYYREEAVLKTDKKSNDLWDEYEAEAKRLGTTPMNSAIDLGYGSPEYNRLEEYFERWKAAREEARKGGGGAVYAAHLALHNPLVYQYEGVTDPFLADQAREHGHDGIIVVGKYAEPGESLLDRAEEILVFKPEQIKSADPVTYDGEGKVIPLSERFDKKTPNIRYAVDAWHGGRELQGGQFNSNYIGTGTNSGVFGWGLYFSSREEVARIYANMAAKMHGTGKRHLYSVTLHKGKGPDQYDYLDWNVKPTEKQITKIKNYLRARGLTYTLNNREAQQSLFGGTGGQTYEALAEMLGSKKAASLFLLNAGIDGTTYRADYVMDNVPPGTKNYVVFDPKAITVGTYIRYAASRAQGAETAKLSLKMVQDAFKGQSVVQDGENFTLTLKNGSTVVIRGVAEITPNSVQLNLGYKQGVAKGKRVLGAFEVGGEGNFTIRVVRDNETAPWTLAHESVHLLVELGIISKADMATISAVARKEGKWDENLSPEENQANWLADFVTKERPKQSVLSEIWQKIKDFVNSITGVRTAEMIGRELQSGKIFERKAEGTPRKNAAIYALFHGTTEGNRFKEFNLDRANWGVGSNPFAQGDKGVYLNDDIFTGRYFSRKANEFHALMRRDRPVEITPQGTINSHDEAWDYLFGKNAVKGETVLEVELASDARVKHLDVYPDRDVIDSLIRSGEYDAVSFPEVGMKYAEDVPADLREKINYESRTTFVFNLEKLKIKEDGARAVPFKQYAVERDPIDSASLFPDVDKNLKAAKGVKRATVKERTKETLVTGWAHFTRHFQHLAKEDAAISDVLRTFQDVPSWAKEETVNRLSLFVGKLTPQGRDVFTMNILLPDMLRDIDNGTLTVDDEGGLPFGYKDRAQVQQDLDHYKAIMAENPDIAEALAKRTAFMTYLTNQLVAHKLLKKEVTENPAAYFHHQVLYYMNYRDSQTFGMSSRDVKTHRKGWQLGRKGSRLDYNTEYIEAEFEVISQALTQIETVKTLKEVERLADIKPSLLAEAKDQNMDIFANKTADQEDPLKPFRVKIAIGFRKLTKQLKDGNLYVPEEFDEVAEFIMEQEEERKAAEEEERDYSPVPHPRMFAFLNYLINHQDSGGAMPAAMIFKAIAGRNAYIKQVVGKDWVTYKDLIPAGFVVHKPESKSTFYFTNGIADQALDAVLAGHKSLPEAVRQVLARGRDEEWVVKEGVSKTLNEFRPRLDESLPAKISKGLLTVWKQWILLNPFRVIKYNLNNMSGDLDIAMAYDPKIITGYAKQAFTDLWAVSQGTASEALKAEVSDLTKRGVIGSGMTQMDIPELGDVKSVKELVDFFDGKSKNALTRWYTYSKKLSTLRENILRLAANRYFLEKLNKGEYVNPGASNKAEIDQVRKELGIEAAAAKLARELIGDYGNISHAGQYMRERLIPFYSWLEINAPRYVRLFRNLKDEGNGGIGAMGGVLAWKATKLSIKAFALMGLIMLWNAAMFPDEEDELQETGREQLHLILGRRADGSIITLRFQGALSDALSWFGMSNPLEQTKKVLSGRKGMKEVAKDVVAGAPLKLFQGVRPEAKLAYEVLSGQSYYPDPTHPRPIRDTAEHILRTFSLDKIYNRAAGKPKQGGTWGSQLLRDVLSLVIYEADPGEQAYYTTRKYIFDWLDSQGKEKPTAIPTNRSNALYYYKQALKYGDIDAAAKYLKKYQDMGGKMHDVQGSIKRVHPLSSLKISDRYKFRQSLSAEQLQTLELATAWYKKHYVETYHEQRRAAAAK